MTGKMQLFYEPIKIKNNLSNSGAEMSEWQSAFVCGLIKEFKPKKILEVGVAAGGTTAIILNCISILGLDAEVYSVDTSAYYYRDKSKKTGYLAQECKQYLNNTVKHKMYTGGVLPEYIDEIGSDIDLLILDTVHKLPGEILDFLVCFPYLKNGSIVVLHDIILNQLGRSACIDSYATKVLLTSVTGEMIMCKGDDTPWISPGIGAFLITDDTRKYIASVFSALTITWNYIPESKHVELYRNCIQKHYENELLEAFDDAVAMNTTTLSFKRNSMKQILEEVFVFCRDVAKRENIYIYGCGVYGTKLCCLMECYGIVVKGYIISDNQEKLKLNKEVKYISEIDEQQCTIILGMNMNNKKSLNINTEGFLQMNKYVLDFLNMYM